MNPNRHLRAGGLAVGESALSVLLFSFFFFFSGHPLSLWIFLRHCCIAGIRFSDGFWVSVLDLVIPFCIVIVILASFFCSTLGHGSMVLLDTVREHWSGVD